MYKRTTDFERIYSPYRAQKGGFFKDAASEGIAILFPDTSPRGAGVEGEDDDWVFISLSFLPENPAINAYIHAPT